MENYSEENLEQAAIRIESLILKCQKSLEKLTDRSKSSQKSLLINRIEALRIALSLIEKEKSKKIPKLK